MLTESQIAEYRSEGFLLLEDVFDVGDIAALRREVTDLYGTEHPGRIFEEDGTTMPESFEEQAELIWKHIHTILRSAGMDVTNIVSLRTYLADPSNDEANARMRAKQLGSHRVSATVVCCQLLEPAWKLEIEAVAAA